MSLFSSFKSLFGRKPHPQATVKPQQTLPSHASGFNQPPKATIKTNPAAIDPSRTQAELDIILAKATDSNQDDALIAFATKSQNTAQRWQAAQAVSSSGWLALQIQVAPRDRRIAKWVKTQIAAKKALQARDIAWNSLSTSYLNLLQTANVDVRHFVELDKVFDTAQAQHGFDESIQSQVASWRNTLQARLHAQNETQRTAQQLLSRIKYITNTAQAGEYNDDLQAQLDTAIAAEGALLPAQGVLAIQRLHDDIKTALPHAIDALATASQTAERLTVVNTLVKQAQTYARQSPTTMEGAEIAGLKKSWRGEFAIYSTQKAEFDAAIAQASAILEAYQAQLANRHEETIAWLTDKQNQLAAALEAGQGQNAVVLAEEINAKNGKSFDTTRLPSEQAAALERLLSQARETRNLLWEGAALERDVILAKVQALAAKPLVGKFQEQALKEATEAWKAITTKSGGAPNAVFMQFKTACEEAYAPVKLYKDNMRQVNTVGNEQRQTLLSELINIQNGIDWSTVDWRGVDDLRREARKQWRECLPPSYKEREALNQSFDTVMAVFDEKLSDARNTELKRRERLTQAALELDGKPFAEQHTGARQLMERYSSERNSVYIPREQDQAAWHTFRAAIDAVYARREIERQTELTENAQAITDLIHTKQAVLAQLKTDIQINEIKPLQTAIVKAQTNWDEPGRLPRDVGEHNGININALVKDWLTTLEAAETKIHSLQLSAKQARIQDALLLAQQLDSLQFDAAPESYAAAWELASKDTLIKKAFTPRITAINNGTALISESDIDVTAITLKRALLEAEIATQTDSPAAHKEARLALQVQRLSDKLTGNTQHSADAGFNAWLNVLTLPNSTQGEAGERIAAMAQQL